jgi:serine/threonine protein kinase
LTALHDVDQLIGRRIGGKYQIASRIGVGAVAMIYRARQIDPPADVALKVVRPEIGRNPTVSARFQREVKAASKLDHPGIVRVLDWGLEQEMPWLAMELIEGEDLFDVLDRSGHLPQSWSVAVAIQVCEALAAAHGQGVVHRDLKPENIMLTVPNPRTGEQHVKVLDFGIAKLLGPSVDDLFSDETVPQVLTKAGSAVGTPSHMAPEQAQGKPVDGRADIYAVGVLLYEMVTGHLPFEGTNPLLVAIQQVKDAPPAPRSYLPTIHPYLEEIILRALEKDPDRRPQSAAELATEMRAVLRGLEEEDGPTVRHPAPNSTIAAIPTSQPTITRIAALRWLPSDDDEDLQTATHVAIDLPDPAPMHGFGDEGQATRVASDGDHDPATRMVTHDGPSTRVLLDDDDDPATRMVLDAGPSTRVIHDDEDDDDGPSTRLVDGPATRVVDDGPSTRLVDDDDDDDGPSTRLISDDGPSTRLVYESPFGDGESTREDIETVTKALEDPDSEDVTIRAQGLFDGIQDELTSLDRRPKDSAARPPGAEPLDPGSGSGPRPRRMRPDLAEELELAEVSTRVVDPPSVVTAQRPAMDSEAPVATVVADADALVGAARNESAGLSSAPVPQVAKRPPNAGGIYSPRRATRRGPRFDIEDHDSGEEPAATVITDPESLVRAARRSAELASQLNDGSGARPRRRTPRPLVGDAVLEAPPPPPPTSEPGGSARPRRAAGRQVRAAAITRGGPPPTEQFPNLYPPSGAVADEASSATAGLPTPAEAYSYPPVPSSPVPSSSDHGSFAPRSAAIVPAQAGEVRVEPLPPASHAMNPDAPGDWGGGPVSRDYAGELEDMLRQMPKQRGRPVFSTIVVIIVITAAVITLAWVMFY